MDATPLLAEVARALREVRLEAVLIGNAAAALQGAPVTTVDFDFFFRRTPANLSKLKAIARALDATVMRPFYPASDLYRVVRDHDGLQVDFMGAIHGLRSFEGVRDRASTVEIDRVLCWLRRSATSSAASALPVGPATGRCSRFWRRPVKKLPDRRARLGALARENERAVREMIRRWQALPPSRRTNFLRKRVAPGRFAL
jgi:hypothetical protein